MSKQAKEEAWQHFLRLLESPDLNAFRELVKAFEETHVKEPWIIESLVDFYTSSDSPRALELITSSNREVDKIICKKLHECFEEPSRRRATLRLLVGIICKQPSWLSRITKERIFNDCIRCLKSETDAPALMYATYAITMLLPIAPDGVLVCLKEILDAFVRVVHIAYASHNSMPEMYQLNLQVGVYSLFVRLYGMFPWSLLSHLQQHCSKPENRQLCKDAMEPMFEQVRLHPLLITSTSRDKELSKERWLGKESQDIIVECSSLALDASEGSCRGGTGSSVATATTCGSGYAAALNVQPSVAGTAAIATAAATPYVGVVAGAGITQDAVGVSPGAVSAALAVPTTGGHSSPGRSDRGLFKVHSTNSMGPAADSLIAAAAASTSFFSPSENFSLLTPPPNLSHSTTPTLRPSNAGSTYDLDESYQASAFARNSVTSIGLPRVGSASFRSGSAGGTPSAGRLVTPQASATPSQVQTPVTAELTASGSTVAPLSGQTSRRHSSGGGGGSGRAGVREPPVALLSLAGIDRDDLNSSRSNSRSEAVPPSPHRKEFTSEPPAGALKAPAVLGVVSSDLAAAAATAAASTAAAVATVPAAKHGDDCSLSVKSLPHLLEKLSDTTSHCGSEMDDSTDEEVSSINQPATPAGVSDGATAAVSVTAESVAAFRKTVNRIRFNSTTVTAGLHQSRSRGGRPKSCPELLADVPAQQVVRPSKAQDDGRIGCNRQSLTGLPTRGTRLPQVARDSQQSSYAAATLQPASAGKARGEDSASQSTAHSLFVAVDLGRDDTRLSQPAVAVSKRDSRQLTAPASPVRARQLGDTGVYDVGAEPVAGGMLPSYLSSSAELLDEYLRQGAQLHARLQSRLSLTDQLSTKWTHFGGPPPADEVAILQGQLLMMHTQLLYERQKREQHALRNRRLLRDVTKAVMLQERNEALIRQVQDLEMDVFNLNASMSIQKEDLGRLRSDLASSEARHSQMLAKKTKQMEELEYARKDLQRRFDSQQAELSHTKKELDATRRRAQLAEQGLQLAGVRMDQATELEAQVQSLTKQLLLMGELQYKYEERLAAAGAGAGGCLVHRSAAAGDKGYSCSLMPGGAPLGVQHQLVADLDRLKKTVAQQADSLEQAQKSNQCLQQVIVTKDKAITDLKKLLEHVKAAHAGQIKAVEDKCCAMRAACQAMEQHTVDLYAQIAFLTPPPKPVGISSSPAAAQAVGSS